MTYPLFDKIGQLDCKHGTNVLPKLQRPAEKCLQTFMRLEKSATTRDPGFWALAKLSRFLVGR